MSDLESYLERHWDWSQKVFGPGRQTGGLTQHIEKELAEVRAKPDDLAEWIDIAILALDGYLRHGGRIETVMRDLRKKQDINFARQWPTPVGDDLPVEHQRSDEQS